jgi:calcineurin-like phosphoesterase family protein
METSSWSISLTPSTADWRLRQLQREVMEQGPGEVSPIPPILTLAGPFTSRPGVEFVNLQEAVASAGIQGPAGYLIDGWGWRRDLEGWILGCRVVPSTALIILADTLHRMVLPLVGDDELAPPRWEVPLVRAPGCQPPESLTAPAPPQKDRNLFSRFISWVRPREAVSFEVNSRIPPLCLPLEGLRLTLLAGEQPAGGYDLVMQTWLNRYRSTSREAWSDTLASYREQILWSSPRRGGPPYLISDLHLGHADIIQYCSRPFPDHSTMDRALIAGWNQVVSPGDQVLFLGDLCGNPTQVPEFLPALSGAITWVQGNHDPSSGEVCERLALTVDGVDLLLVHDPADAPPTFDGWVVHGHTHNRRLHRYPFLSVRRRTINVSAEVIGYRPVSLSSLVAMIHTSDHDLLVSPLPGAEDRCYPEPLSDQT